MTVSRIKQNPQRTTDSLARILGIIATVVGLTSFWLSYVTSLPVLSESAELLDPIRLNEPLHFKIRVDNFGRTSARHMNSTVAIKLQRADLPFELSYSSPPQPPRSFDLAPAAHTDLVTVDPLHLEHDHDVDAVLSGQYVIYLYGKIIYDDAFHRQHEFHFCRYYQATAPNEPNRLLLCPSYNGDD